MKYNERVTDVWFNDPQGRTLRIVSGVGSRVHAGPPAARISNGRMVYWQAMPDTLDIEGSGVFYWSQDNGARHNR